MNKYPGLREHFGRNGGYRVINPASDTPVIEVYLRSVPAFECGRSGHLIIPDPSARKFPDITFRTQNDERFCSVISMEADSFGLSGVNSFIQSLLETGEDLNDPAALLGIIRELLERHGAPWGRPPQDSPDAAFSVGSSSSHRTHPGI